MNRSLLQASRPLPNPSSINYQALLEAVKHLQANRPEVAKQILLGYFNSLSALKENDIQAYIFAKALLKRFSEETLGEKNLYLQEADSVLQIDLFNLLAKRFPLVSASKDIANTFLSHLIQGKEQVTLLDIGIGSGHQEEALFRLLASKNAMPAEVTIIGIEPAEESLNVAEERFSALGEELNINLHFIPIPKFMEDFTQADWAELQQHPNLIIYEAFALHHLSDRGGQDMRTPILKELKALNPMGFILLEPHSDHHTNCLVSRFKNCWKHFGLAFQLIDRLDLSASEKEAMKLHFFGREIEDILGNPDTLRTERHETASMWLKRLKQANFKPHQVLYLLANLDNEFIQLSRTSQYVSLDVDNQPVVSVICVT